MNRPLVLENEVKPSVYRPTATNIRQNGKTTQRVVSQYTAIIGKPNEGGLEIHVADNAPFEAIDIPVLITEAGLQEVVKNDIFVGEGANVIILASCNICVDGCANTAHRGVHNFYVGKNAKLKYIERHYAVGKTAYKEISPTSAIQLEAGAEMIIETSQLGGVDHSQRTTEINLASHAKLTITERVFTSQQQSASSSFHSIIKAKNANLKISSRAIATEQSSQQFVSNIIGDTTCFAHIECDAIIQSRAQIQAVPQIYAKHPEARLIHEANIGKIAGEQLNKLMSLGLSKKNAEQVIIDGFLR